MESQIRAVSRRQTSRCCTWSIVEMLPCCWAANLKIRGGAAAAFRESLINWHRSPGQSGQCQNRHVTCAKNRICLLYLRAPATKKHQDSTTRALHGEKT